MIMASANKVFLIGNVTRDVELRYTPGGVPTTTLGLAASERWKDKDGNDKEETLFVDIDVWDRQAETVSQFVKKGSLIYVEGRLKLDSWDDKTTGEKRSKLKVRAERIQFLNRKEDESAPATGGKAATPPSRPSRGSQPAAGGRSGYTPPPSANPDEDIPF
jgi:single-strand DNA-binding protein